MVSAYDRRMIVFAITISITDCLTSSTPTIPAMIDYQILTFIFVTMLAMRFKLIVKNSFVNYQMLFRCDHFKMFRIYAISVFAQMMQINPFGNRTYVKYVSPSMCHDGTISFVPDFGNIEQTIATWCQAFLPKPTSICIDNVRGLKSLNQRLSFVNSFSHKNQYRYQKEQKQ